MRVDVLIVGQGLAGTAVALALRERGKRVFVVDRDEAVTSSKIAAGLITPVTGKNLSLSWRIAELWPVAKAFWQDTEDKLGASFLHEMSITRLFKDEEETKRWESRKTTAGIADFLDDEFKPPPLDGKVRAEFGGFTMKKSGWLDVPKMLMAVRKTLEAESSFAIGSVESESLTETEDGYRWNEVEAERVVFCQGFAAAKNPLFDSVSWRAAKGEIIDVRFEETFSNDQILNRGSWLLPTEDGIFRSGATYAWDRLDTEPTGEARETLCERLEFLTNTPFEIIGQSAAVRPIIRESKLLMGWHPTKAKIGFFNGLGSKGVLTAPFFARQFAAALDGDGGIEPDVDFRKNL
ncbi:MAG: FAD-binding oxidoreductase [Verrucomicrobiota bacterium]